MTEHIEIKGKRYILKATLEGTSRTMADRWYYVQRPKGSVIYQIADMGDGHFGSPKKVRSIPRGL
jgi:hypothetical protein